MCPRQRGLGLTTADVGASRFPHRRLDLPVPTSSTVVEPYRKTQAQRRAQTHAALLEAAREVFAERGFHSTTGTEVAKRAGVTTGALYFHFADKNELFLAVLEEARELSSFALLIEFWSQATRSPEFRPALAARFKAARKASAGALQAEALKRGIDLEGGDAERLGSLLSALRNGLALEREVDPDADSDKLLDFFEELVFRALGRRTAGAVLSAEASLEP